MGDHLKKTEPKRDIAATDKPSLLSGLIARDEETFEKILVKLLEPTDVETKTEVQEPIPLTQLDILAVWLENEGARKSSTLTKAFAHQFRINMVSHKRQSRTEVVKALTEGIKQERTLSEKLMTKPS